MDLQLRAASAALSCQKHNKQTNKQTNKQIKRYTKCQVARCVAFQRQFVKRRLNQKDFKLTQARRRICGVYFKVIHKTEKE
jgi:hypothetical protein